MHPFKTNKTKKFVNDEEIRSGPLAKERQKSAHTKANNLLFHETCSLHQVIYI